ncbi:MAG: 4-amino-4-deoxy-L-arabinose transferase-like glycosyltransferase [Bacteroidia bacterium]
MITGLLLYTNSSQRVFLRFEIQMKKSLGLILLLAIVVLALSYRAQRMPLSADEPIRALVALDMELSGHFWAPELNGDVYLNKPPLYNWILLLCFKLFGSHAEWVVRLPSILSIFIFTWLIFKLVHKKTQDLQLSYLSAGAFITAGNLLFYSSYLGHIDVLYSLITFVQLLVILEYHQTKKWLKLFACSYFLMMLGFMMKGLPSIVFQGVSLLAIFVSQKSFKKLFVWQHLVGALFFLIPVASYFYIFNQKANLQLFINNLIHESTSRTVTDKSFIESVAHIVSFPLLFVLDCMPWGLAILIFLRKEARNFVWENSFFRACIILFFANIVIYWLSPDYRARYVFMLIPFILVPTLAAYLHIFTDKQTALVAKVFLVLSISAVIGMAAFIHFDNKLNISVMDVIVAVVLINVLISSYLYLKKTQFQPLIFVVVALCIVRIGYSQFMVPWRITTGPYQQEKDEAKRIISNTDANPVYMYHSNVSLTMNWYMSIEKNQMITTERTPTNMNAFYLVPSDVLKDSSNVVVHDTFVRRFKQKPFSLVTFTSYFPPMPKKSE